MYYMRAWNPVCCARYKCDSVMQGGMDERNPAQIFPNLSHSCDHRGFKLSVLSSCSLIDIVASISLKRTCESHLWIILVDCPS